MIRVQSIETILDRSILIREAEERDVGSIQNLFREIYEGKYPIEFGQDPEILRAEIRDDQHYLWLIAEFENKTIGAMMFSIDLVNRLGKASGGVVSKEFRKGGLGARLLKIGVGFITTEVDVVFGTTRSVNEGPSKMVAEVGFQKMGIFPNAVQIENLEHLNLDVYLTDSALKKRRRKPYLYPPFQPFYEIARKKLGLEKCVTVREREPFKLFKNPVPLNINKDEKSVISKFHQYTEQNRISSSFFPFHLPNMMLSSDDGGSEVFIWYTGFGKQAAIVGFRTDWVNKQDLLNSVAIEMQKAGASYVELLVDAYDYICQQEAYTARFLPSAFFPSLRVAKDGKRDDYFILSRTFGLLDFTGSVVTGDSQLYLREYLKCYYEIYIEPILRSEKSDSSQKYVKKLLSLKTISRG